MVKKVEIFTSSHCPACSNAKRTLEVLGIEFTELDVYTHKDAFIKRTGAKTVPQIFIGETLIGGNDKLQEMVRDCTLKELLLEDE